MKYELAEKLWDAKYPFKFRDSSLSLMCMCTGPVCKGPWGTEFRFENKLYPEPTLAELIEAVRTNGLGAYTHADFKLTYKREGKNWRAMLIQGGIIYGDGATPEEAVARLWLKLNRV